MKSDQWRVPPQSHVDLTTIDPASTALAPGSKKETQAASEQLREQLVELQERLWAEDKRALLLVLQAMDAGGKDGALRRVFSGVNPQGCRVTSFKQPSEEELSHDFLWRIEKAVPSRGEIGIFNRSHYEDVVAVRVRGLASESVWRPRFAIINAFEFNLNEAGTRVVKAYLHISKEEQAARLRKRLDNPDKRWKFRASDLEERARWDDYMQAYAEALSRTSRPTAPWYVIPADHKWYRDWALLTILVETLTDMDPRYPTAEEPAAGEADLIRLWESEIADHKGARQH